MKAYEEIKKELLNIAEVLKKYPESIQPKVFDILTKTFLGESFESDSEEIDLEEPKKSSKKAKPVVNPPKKSAKPRDTNSITMLKDLDLRGDGSHKSFKEFFNEKMPKSSNEFNATAVYYLSEILKIQPVTPNHVYTCYKEVTKRPPDAFVQSLRDTANKSGYIDTKDINNIKLPMRGKNFAEHDLPKKKGAEK